MEGEWSCYRGGHFNRGSMVKLERWSLYWRENGYVMEVVSFMEGAWSCYRSAHFNGHMYILLYCVVSGVCFLYTVNITSLMEGESSSSRGHQCFPPHCKFLHTGERDDFMPAKR